MYFSNASVWFALTAIVSLTTAVVAGTPVIHFEQDFTDGSLDAEVGSLTNIPAELALRNQQSWRNPLQTYFGIHPSVAFDGFGGFGDAKEFRMTTENNAVLQSGNVWVFDISLISDVATTGSQSFGTAPGVVAEWDFRTAADFTFSSSAVSKLAPAVSNASNARGSILATAYSNGQDPNVEPTALGNSLAAAGLPAALDNTLRAKYVYQPITGPHHTRVSTQALNGEVPIGNAAHSDGTAGTFRSDYSGGLLAQMLSGHGTGNVTYSAGHGGGSNVLYNAAHTNLELGLTHLSFKQVQATDFNTDSATDAADATILMTNVGGANKSFFDGDVNGDGSVDATSDGFTLLQNIGGASGTASAKLNSATGEILLTTSNVLFVELRSAGDNLIPENAVALGSVANATFQDAATAGLINYAGLDALGSGGTLTNFSIGNVLPNGFTNLADLQLRYLNGSTEVLVGVTLLSVPGDFNGDDNVNILDYVAWRMNDGTPTGYDAWRENYAGGISGAGTHFEVLAAAVPEASALALISLGLFGMITCNLRRLSREDQ